MSLGAMKGYDEKLHKDGDNTGFGGFVVGGSEIPCRIAMNGRRSQRRCRNLCQTDPSHQWITVDVDVAKTVWGINENAPPSKPKMNKSKTF
ncbi:hypothetical protein COP2_003601 [Malus domestica]